MESVPRLSDKAKAALDVFYLGLNDVNFYFEDSGSENLYQLILKKFFGEIRIERVFALSGKRSLISHNEAPENSGIPARVYVLDKDFDDLLGNIVQHKNIFYLERFCIENYLMEEDAIVELIIEAHPTETRDSVKTRVDQNALIERQKESLTNLFAMFFLVQKLDLGLPNCRLNPERFCSQDRLWELESDRIDAYKAELNSELRLIGESDLDADYKADPRLAEYFSPDLDKIVSGKFLLAMLLHKAKREFNLGAATFASLSYRLAKNCGLSALDELMEEMSVHIANELQS